MKLFWTGHSVKQNQGHRVSSDAAQAQEAIAYSFWSAECLGFRY